MITETAFENLLAFRLADDDVRLTVLPHWGGKVAEVFDVRRGREWMFRNPALPYRLPRYDSNYVRDGDVGGFDECFPNVGPGAYPSGPWRGVPLPDHGEVWAIPWETQILGETLFLAVHGIRLPYRLEKSIRLLGRGRVRFEYRALNLAPFPMPFLWSSPPLFPLRPGMRLSLPAAPMRVYAAPAFPAHHGDVIDWPHAGGHDLSLIPEPAAGLAPPNVERLVELIRRMRDEYLGQLPPTFAIATDGELTNTTRELELDGVLLRPIAADALVAIAKSSSPEEESPARQAARLRDLFELSLLGGDLDASLKTFVDRVALTFRAADCVIWGPAHEDRWPKTHRPIQRAETQAFLLWRCDLALTCGATASSASFNRCSICRKALDPRRACSAAACSVVVFSRYWV